MTGRLEGRVALVTGAGQGIGRAIVLAFAREGARVVAASRSGPELQELAKDAAGAGLPLETQVLDVSKGPAVEEAIRALVAARGRLDILVNNAGVMDDFHPVGDVSDEVWRRVLGINLDGVMYACRAAVGPMAKQGGGAILNIASIGGLQGARAGAAYTASKHAVVGLTKNTAFMYAKQGIRCNAIAPGGVATHIGAGMQPDKAGFERMMSGIGSNVRTGQPEEIAALAVFLCSDEASLVNGAVVVADGGWTAY